MKRWLSAPLARVRAYIAGPRRSALVSAAIALLVLAIVWGAASVWYRERLLENERQRVAAQLIAYDIALTTVVNERVALLGALAAFAQSHSEADLATDFEPFVGALYPNAPGVRSFALAPGGTVRYVYPLMGNEILLHHDWLNDERAVVRADVLRAVQSRRVVLSDPYELRRGGQGVAVYLAVYHDDAFWGLVSITLDLPAIVTEAGLDVRRDDLELAMWDHQGVPFFGESALARANPAVHRVNLRDFYWELAGVPRVGWDAAIRERLLLFQVLIGFIGVLVVGLTCLIVNRQARLEHHVRARTAELAASEQRYRDVFDTAPLAFVLWDRECRVTDWNRHAEQVFGWSRAEAVGRNFFQFLIPESARPQVEAVVARLREGKLPSHSVNENLTKEGRIILCQWENTLRYDAAGNWVGATSLGLDITARQRAEAALQEYSHRLEQMVDERTRELRDAQTRLLQQERLAILGQLAGGIAHELRSPLGAIKNAVYYLRTSLAEPPADAREMLQILDQQVDASARIISSLLDFARPREPVLRQVDVREVVHAALRQADLPANVAVHTQFADELPPLTVDAEQLHIVFDNLIRNAAQAMPAGGELTISGQRSGVSGQPSAIEIRVSDTGVGIAPDALDQVFQPLYTTKAKGIGLGLPLCKMIVEAYGGEIAVESQIGKGATFTVRLPLGERRNHPAEGT